MKKISTAQIAELAAKYKIEIPALQSFIAVESAGSGFDAKTGKIIIQFEPKWFQRYTKTWINNGVRPQAEEWVAFNQAFKINPEAAMLSTSVGMMQVMGFNYKVCGYKSVGAMWDAFKESEHNQVEAGLKFVKANSKLYKALKEKDWNTVAYYYNGPKYADHGYHLKMAKHYTAFSKKNTA